MMAAAAGESEWSQNMFLPSSQHCTNTLCGGGGGCEGGRETLRTETWERHMGGSDGEEEKVSGDKLTGSSGTVPSRGRPYSSASLDAPSLEKSGQRSCMETVHNSLGPGLNTREGVTRCTFNANICSYNLCSHTPTHLYRKQSIMYIRLHCLCSCIYTHLTTGTLKSTHIL